MRVDLYCCEPGEAKFYGFHMNGAQHAAFCSEYAAHSWMRGLREPMYFYCTNAAGERVRFAMNGAGHAYAIMEKIG